MDPRTQERVEEWDSRPFNGGFDGLSDLAAADFSGAVSAVGTWLFMLNGRIIGIVDGDIEDFETASGTQYEAPHPSLPLLCAMEERGGETRAKYYTNETPLREVDDTLQSGSFTGYIELSENVLSGDYYAVYYGGRRMAAAYIGNAERLLTGDEAFERAADEVGIYEVTDVEIDVTDVPGTADADGDTGPADETTAEPDSSPAAGSVSETDPSASAVGSDASDRDESGSEPAVETAGSAIDPIDVSSTEPTEAVDAAGADPIEDEAADDPSSLTGDIDLTGEVTGITATDDAATEPESTTAGITDTDPSVTDSGSVSDTDPPADDSSPSSDTDPTPDTGPATDSDSSPGSAPSDGDVDDRERDSIERVQQDRATADETAAPVTDDAPAPSTDGLPDGDSPADESGETDVEPGAGDESDTTTTASSSADGGGAEVSIDVTPADEPATEAETENETDADTGAADSSPDLAEVEAAAEELERNDISWVDEEGEPGPADRPTAADPATESGDAPADGEEGYLDEQLEREEAWRETRRIPSIDPDDSEPAAETDSREGGRRTRTSRSSASSAKADAATAATSDGTRTASNDGERPAESTTSTAASTETREERSQTGTRKQKAAAAQSESSADEQAAEEKRQRIDALTEKIEKLQEQRDALATKAEELEAERDRLRSTNDELSSTVERLQSRIEELEAELERERERTGESGADAAGSEVNAGTRLSAQQALSGTNLFVRYASKSQPTLETAHDGDADRSEVASNLQLEHHTQFDSADAAVDGEPYADFLPSSMEFRFVDWLTAVVLYEIRDTGNANGLADLYDAIPRIDRAELDATISLEDDDTEDVPDQVTFDIVAFDKMGNPLVLVTLNDSREPATKGMLEGLEEAASAVKANYPDLAAAFAVTSSYFEPGALEVAEQATAGGFLSRGSKLSYVNLSRKDGYHLCLVESRSDGFHMNVPEL